jgi:hypothetical protein
MYFMLSPPARTPHDSRLLTPPHRQCERQLIAAQLVATSMIGNCPSQTQHLVYAAGAQPTTVHRLVDALQTVRKR